MSYTDELDGGGQEFGRAYIPFIKDNFHSLGDVLEWCCGPSFIGFSLLGQGLCSSLGLADVNGEAIKACDTTVLQNDLLARVTTFESDCFDGIPHGRKWDLVIGNPPHVNTTTPGETDFQRRKPQVIYLDRDWAIHRRFYSQVGGFLKSGGSVVLLEKYRFAQPETFYAMIDEGGLDLHKVIQCSDPYEDYYLIWSWLRN